MARFVRSPGQLARPLLFILLLGVSALSTRAQSHFSCLDGAGNIFNATVIVPAAEAPVIDGTAITPGSEIAVYTSNPSYADVCVGKLTWQASSGAITVWGDDNLTTARDGLMPGENLVFRLWDSNSGLEHEIKPADVSYNVGDGVYAHDATFVLSALSVTSDPVEIVGITANSDVAATNEDEVVEIDVLANDSGGSYNLDPSSIAILNPPENGVVTGINPATGVITYRPDTDYFGSDAFSYVVFSDDGTDSKTASVNIEIADVNDPPRALTDATVLDEDQDVLILVLSNDLDVDDDLDYTSIVIYSQPQFGEILGIDPATGAVSYRPGPNYYGQDGFTYALVDPHGAESELVPVEITINSVNDAPDAIQDIGVTDEDTQLKVSILDNDSDVDGDEIDTGSVQIRTYPTHGSIKNVHPATGQVTYLPDANFFGTDSFSYKVRDIHGRASNEVTVQMTVNEINDAPVLAEYPIESTGKGKKYGHQAKFKDADNDPLTITGRVAPSWLTVTDYGDGTAYMEGTPPFEETGAFDVELFADDGRGGTLSYAFQLVVTDNAAPIAAADLVSVPEDGQIVIDVLTNDIDPEGDALVPSSVTIISEPAYGTVTGIDPGSGLITYVPNTDYHGLDSFEYVVYDDIGNRSNIVQVNITVTSTGDAPSALGESVATMEDSEIIIDVLRNDVDADGGVLWISSTGSSSHGQLIIGQDGDDITYVPSENFNGTDSFTYTVVDADGLTATATVTIVVNAVNDAPVLRSLPTASLSTGVPYSYELELEDVDGDDLSVTFQSAPSWLHIETEADGTNYLRGTPSLSDLGPHNVMLRVSDGVVTLQYEFVLAVSEIGNQLTARTELTSPEWGATNIPSDTRFVWNRITGAEEYQLQVSRESDPSFSNPLFDRAFAYGASALTTTVSYMVFSLPEGETLIWRVRGQNAGGPSPWSDTGQYQTSGQTSTPNDTLDELPATTELFQNYPNPFNPSTTISFEIPSTSDVTLTIYDMMGREIETLVSSTLSAGRHEVRWEAGDRASGVYLYRLRSGSFVKSKTLMLVK